MTFKSLIINNFDEIVIALLNIKKERYNSLTFLENFTDLNYSKSVVWDISAGFDFAMCNFFFSYHYQYPYELINNWDDIGDKQFYLQRIQEFFVIDSLGNISLTQKKDKKINEIKKWINYEHEINAIKINNLFAKNNDILKEKYVEDINKKNNEFINSRNEVIKKYNYNFSKDFDIGTNSDKNKLNIKDETFSIPFDVEYNQDLLEVCKKIDKKCNLEIYKKEILPLFEKKIYDFNILGINNFIELIKNENFNHINFNLEGELYLFKRKIKSENWEWIEKNKFSLNKNKFLGAKVIYKGSLPVFKNTLLDFKIENYSDEAISTYLEKNNVSDDYYKISNIYFTKTKALEIIDKKYKIANIIFRYQIDIPKNFNGIKIEFDYAKLKK